MAASLPPSNDVAGSDAPGPEEPRLQCLSSDYGSEVNDSFPHAMALDAAAGPDQQSFSRTASQRVMDLIRRSTGSMKPGRNGAVGREDTKHHSSGEAEVAAAAAAVVAATSKNKADGQRTAVPPTSPRPSKSFSLRRKLSDMLGIGAHKSNEGTTDAGLDWKPHEEILKLLGYRPRGHGRPFTDSYTLSGVLGMGGFGVVREGMLSQCKQGVDSRSVLQLAGADFVMFRR